MGEVFASWSRVKKALREMLACPKCKESFDKEYVEKLDECPKCGYKWR